MSKETYEKTFVDESTGEVKKVHQSFRKLKTQDKFLILFTAYLEIIMSVNSKPERLILTEFIGRCTYNTNIAYVPVKVKEEILNKYNLTDGVYRNALLGLKKKKLIYYEKGVIELNPFVMWIGNTDVRLDFIHNSHSELVQKFTQNGLDS